MKTEAMRNSAFHQFAQKDHIFADFLDCYMEILYPRIYVFEVVQFVIVGGEESLGSIAPFVDIFDNRTCYGHTVIGRCSSSDLVKEHQRTRGQIMQNHRSLQHLDHKGRFAARYIVRCSNAGEYLVAEAYFCGCCRHERAHLSHKHYKRRLPQQSRFSGHIRTCKDYHLLFFIVKIYVIWNEFLASLHHGLDDRMTSLPDINDLAVIHLRTAVIVAYRQVSKAGKHVQTRKDAAVLLNHRNIRLNPCH